MYPIAFKAEEKGCMWNPLGQEAHTYKQNMHLQL